VRYLIRNPGERRFRGYIEWDIPLLVGGSFWKAMWDKYMVLKTQHQKNVMKTSITGFDFKSSAKKYMEKIENYLLEGSTGFKLAKGKLKNDIYAEYADRTNEERRMLYDEILHWYNSTH